MESLKFIGIVIIAALIFTPINNKYHLHSKYHDHSNKGFRLAVVFTGLLLVLISIGIGALSDEYLRKYHLYKDSISLILTILMVFIVLVAVPKGRS